MIQKVNSNNFILKFFVAIIIIASLFRIFLVSAYANENVISYRTTERYGQIMLPAGSYGFMMQTPGNAANTYSRRLYLIIPSNYADVSNFGNICVTAISYFLDGTNLSGPTNIPLSSFGFFSTKPKFTHNGKEYIFLSYSWSANTTVYYPVDGYFVNLNVYDSLNTNLLVQILFDIVDRYESVPGEINGNVSIDTSTIEQLITNSNSIAQSTGATVTDIKNEMISGSSSQVGFQEEDRLLLKRYDIWLVMIAFATVLALMRNSLHQMSRNIRGK